MAKLVSIYSNTVSVSIAGSSIAEFYIRNLTVNATSEGPQILVKFNQPITSDFKKIYIVRKIRSYPLNLTDGVKVYEGTNNVYADRDVKGGQCYYYSIFTEVNDGTIYFDQAYCSGFAIAFETGFFPEYIYEQTTSNYQVKDATTSKKVLIEEQTDEGDYVNINETGESKFQLQRFFKATKLELDRIKSLIDYSPTLLDIDNCPEYALPYISHLLGVIFNADVPIEARRAELKNIIGIYKTKGTPESIKSQLQSISRLDIELQEYFKNILKSNRNDRTSAKIGPIWYKAIGLEGDPSANSLNFDENGKYDARKYGVWFIIEDDKTLTKAVVDKTNRILPDHEPANAIHLLGAYSENEESMELIIDDIYDDQFEFANKFELTTINDDNEYSNGNTIFENIEETHFTDINEIPHEEDLYDTDEWLYSNDITKLSNDPLIQSIDYIFDYEHYDEITGP